jgi:dimethylargininase
MHIGLPQEQTGMNSDNPKEESIDERLFERVFVRPPPNDYPNCNSTNPDKEGIDLVLARKQHREYISILKESGLEVVQLPVLDGYPDSVFTQDPAIIGIDTTIVGRFGLDSRAGEETEMVDDLRAGDWEIGAAQFIKEPGQLEGGDVMITDTRIFVGNSSRTNKEGIRQLASQLQDRPITPVKTKSFHLLCGCSYIGRNTIAVAPSIVDVEPFAGFNLIQIPKEEEYAANILRLGKRKILIPSGYPKTYQKLRSAGFQVVEIDNSEFYKGDGGLTCLSSPIYRVL